MLSSLSSVFTNDVKCIIGLTREILEYFRESGIIYFLNTVHLIKLGRKNVVCFLNNLKNIEKVKYFM